MNWIAYGLRKAVDKRKYFFLPVKKNRGVCKVVLFIRLVHQKSFEGCSSDFSESSSHSGEEKKMN